jgi:hypothetical protein
MSQTLNQLNISNNRQYRRQGEITGRLGMLSEFVLVVKLIDIISIFRVPNRAYSSALVWVH